MSRPFLLFLLAFGCDSGVDTGRPLLEVGEAPVRRPAAPVVGGARDVPPIPEECEAQYYDCLTRSEPEPCILALDQCAERGGAEAPVVEDGARDRSPEPGGLPGPPVVEGDGCDPDATLECVAEHQKCLAAFGHALACAMSLAACVTEEAGTLPPGVLSILSCVDDFGDCGGTASCATQLAACISGFDC